MKNKILILLLAAVAACDSATGVETRKEAKQFPVRANWTAAAAPVGASTVQATLQVTEYVGSRLDVELSLTGGAPNTAYQWRIYRGDCSVNTPRPTAGSPHGLLVIPSDQSYPDVTTDATGNGSASQQGISAALDSLTAYSVRVRLGQAATSWNGTNPTACGNLQRS